MQYLPKHVLVHLGLTLVLCRKRPQKPLHALGVHGAEIKWVSCGWSEPKGKQQGKQELNQNGKLDFDGSNLWGQTNERDAPDPQSALNFFKPTR